MDALIGMFETAAAQKNTPAASDVRQLMSDKMMFDAVSQEPDATQAQDVSEKNILYEQAHISEEDKCKEQVDLSFTKGVIHGKNVSKSDANAEQEELLKI